MPVWGDDGRPLSEKAMLACDGVDGRFVVALTRCGHEWPSNLVFSIFIHVYLTLFLCLFPLYVMDLCLVYVHTLVRFVWDDCIIIMSFLCLIFFLFLFDMSFSLVLIMSFCPVSIYYHTGLCWFLILVIDLWVYLHNSSLLLTMYSILYFSVFYLDLWTDWIFMMFSS